MPDYLRGCNYMSAVERRLTVLILAAIALAGGCGPSTTNGPTTSSEDSQQLETPLAPPATSKESAPLSTEPTLDELLLFFPAKYPDGYWEPKGLRYEDVWFSAKDGTRLHAWYCPCDKPRAVLLYAHGNGGNLSYEGGLLRYFQEDLQVCSLIFDYRGYGRSEGVPTVEGVLEDARAARTILARRAAIKETQIVLMGRSLGGAVVIQLAAESAPRGLIVESAFSSLRDAAAYHYPKLAWLVPAAKLDSATQIARFKGPLLQSHGDADRTIPYSLGEKLFKAANEPKRFVTIPGGDHNDARTIEYTAELARFVATLSEE
jgi:uncharacterized protein